MVVNLGLHYGSLGPKPKQMTLDEKFVGWIIVDNVVWALGLQNCCPLMFKYKIFFPNYFEKNNWGNFFIALPPTKLLPLKA
jgi:hypothetical protein